MQTPAGQPTELAAVDTLGRTTCSRSSILPFATGPKRSIRRLLGGEKSNFFNSRYRRSHQGGRASENLRRAFDAGSCDQSNANAGQSITCNNGGPNTAWKSSVRQIPENHLFLRRCTQTDATAPNGVTYEEDPVEPVVSGARGAARVAYKPTLRRISPTNVKTSSLKTR